MKTLKLDHDLAELVVRGEKTSTWRLFDDKDLTVGDEVQLIDKVGPDNRDTWKLIGTATINEIVQKRLGDLGEADMGGHEKFRSREEMLATYQRYYGVGVSLQTPVKIIRFAFTPRIAGSEDTEILPRSDTVIVYADGGSRGNPGPSASGYALYDDHGTLLISRGSYLGITTNNQAEYTALKLALEEAKVLGARKVDAYMDSMLVINQMRGIFKVKNRDLWPIHDAVKELCKQFERVTFTQVPRELNKLADAAVNEALDKHQADTRVR
jgi:ribonuclease HI